VLQSRVIFARAKERELFLLFSFLPIFHGPQNKQTNKDKTKKYIKTITPSPSSLFKNKKTKA